MTAPVAVILAAGLGRRLASIAGDVPKALVALHGRTLLERELEALAAAGVPRVAIVTGHRADLVASFLEGRDAGLEVTCVHNADYATSNNVVSFLAAADELADGGYLLNSDIVFDPAVLADLVAAEPGAYLVVDSDEPLGAEEMKVQLDDEGYIQRVSKLLPPETSAGEYIGITRLDAAAATAAVEAARALVAEGRSDMYYEDAFDRAAARMRLRPFPTRRRAWTEIDDVADHERALGVASTLDAQRG